MNDLFNFLSTMSNAVAGLALIFGLLAAYLIWWKVAGKDQADARRNAEKENVDGQKAIALSFQAATANMLQTAERQGDTTAALATLHNTLLTEHRKLLEQYQAELARVLVAKGGA